MTIAEVSKKYDLTPDTIRYYETYINLIDEYIKKYNKNQKFVDTLNIKIVNGNGKYNNYTQCLKYIKVVIYTTF